MKIYCINLKRSMERREKMAAELSRLGLPYEFIDAVDGRALCTVARDASYSHWRTLLRHGKGLTPGEIGCSMSHVKFFEQIVENGVVGFVVEDDVSFGDDARRAFEQAGEFLREAKGPTLVQMPGHDRDARGGKDGDERFVEVSSAMGTYAYGINPEAAKLLLKAFSPIRMPIDKYDYVIRHYGLKFYVYSKIILKVDMDGQSTIGSDRDVTMGLLKTCCYKMWRVVGRSVDYVIS